MRWNPIDHMNAACANKPRSGGKNYKRGRCKQADYDTKMPAGSHERFCYELQQSWRGAKESLIEDFTRYLYPERYEGFV